MPHSLWSSNRQSKKASRPLLDRAAALRKYDHPLPTVVIRKERPGPNHRHLLRVADIRCFIALLPRWDELSVGLKTVVLAAARPNADGWHQRGVVAVCAWPRCLSIEIAASWYRDHASLLRRLKVPVEHDAEGAICSFTEETARAYLLLHVFLHELGHHHDRMTTRSKKRASRGEQFAEKYALENERVIWERYREAFGF